MENENYKQYDDGQCIDSGPYIYFGTFYDIDIWMCFESKIIRLKNLRTNEVIFRKAKVRNGKENSSNRLRD